MKLNKMKALHEAVGGQFFSRKTVNYWGSRVETLPNEEGLFITSETDYEGTERLYTIRRFTKTYDVETVGEFQGYSTKEDALKAL